MRHRVRRSGAGKFVGDLGRHPQLTQLFAQLRMLLYNRIDVGIAPLDELFSQLCQEPGELIVACRRWWFQGR